MVATLLDTVTVKLFSTLIGLTLFCALVPLESASAQGIPLPRPRPAQAGGSATTVAVEPAPPSPSACRLRLTDELATAPSLPELAGAGDCEVEDMVRLEAVMLPDKTRVAVMPPAIVRCAFAETIVHWLRDDIAPIVRTSRTVLKSVDNFASYECRGRNRVPGAKVSEHGKGNAIDLRSFRLADGKILELTDPHVPKELREALRRSACERFTTVLGPGSDGYHENHVHFDLIERRRGHRICQWDVREPGQEMTSGMDRIPLPRRRPTALAK
jgi:hypothetical protein